MHTPIFLIHTFLNKEQETHHIVGTPLMVGVLFGCSATEKQICLYFWIGWLQVF